MGTQVREFFACISLRSNAFVSTPRRLSAVDIGHLVLGRWELLDSGQRFSVPCMLACTVRGVEDRRWMRLG